MIGRAVRQQNLYSVTGSLREFKMTISHLTGGQNEQMNNKKCPGF